MRALHEPVPRLSVLMPCYNAAGTLDEALDSLAEQTLKEFEIIAVDDGSSDETLQHLQERALWEPRLIVLGQKHGGIIQALNKGLKNCRSEFIARMDTDDLSYPTRFEEQLNFLQGHPHVDVVGCLVEGFPDSQVRQGFRIYIDWLNSLVTDNDIRREIFIESPIAHPSIMVRRECLVAVGGYLDNGWAEDYDLLLRLYLDGAHFGKVPNILLKWRERPERLTRTDNRYSLENFIRLKAHYLVRGPLANRGAVLIWGAGMVGRRLAKHLAREGAPLSAFVDIDPRKIGRTRRGLPILPPEMLLEWWGQADHPAVLAAVGARGARKLIRERLTGMGLKEGVDWWGVA